MEKFAVKASVTKSSGAAGLAALEYVFGRLEITDSSFLVITILGSDPRREK
jgi:hypothetical protein